MANDSTLAGENGLASHDQEGSLGSGSDQSGEDDLSSAISNLAQGRKVANLCLVLSSLG